MFKDEILKDPIYQSVKNSESNRKNNKSDKNSIGGIQNAIAVNRHTSADNSIISVDCVKKANQKNSISAYEHFVGFSKLSPYLESFASLNPGFRYKLDKDKCSNEFKRLAILFPYSISAKQYCFKVYGIDAAHIGTHEVRAMERKILETLIDWPFEMRIMFQKHFLFAVSGRTCNNEMILFAICIGLSECIADYEFFFQFLSDNGVTLNLIYYSYYNFIFIDVYIV